MQEVDFVIDKKVCNIDKMWMNRNVVLKKFKL